MKNRYFSMSHFILLLPDDTIIADLTKPTGSHNIFTFFTFYLIHFWGFMGDNQCIIILYTSRFHLSRSTTVRKIPFCLVTCLTCLKPACLRCPPSKPPSSPSGIRQESCVFTWFQVIIFIPLQYGITVNKQGQLKGRERVYITLKSVT